ncbi:MAG: glucosamine-6-phosphate deaminase [Alphaproteobacteria bacterium]|nr:glucosamine-6-phosphate deaminase [Alphaproteobacteria bacterium]
MNILSFETVAEVADYAAKEIMNAIKGFTPTPEKPYLVLGLPTGSTPIPVYERLIRAYQNEEISFKNVMTFNMDEYIGLTPDHPQSYHYFMQENLFKYVDIPPKNIHIPDGMANNIPAFCLSYEQAIKDAGGIDIQLAGIGENGHLAFNEPDTTFNTPTHEQALTQSTIEANSRFFDKIEDVPTKAITIGLKTIFEARRIIVLATGSKKVEAIHLSTKGPISVKCPASMLQNHSNVEFVCDKKALER